MSGDEDGPFDVAVVVFVRVPAAVDDRDAGHVAEAAVRNAVCGSRLGTPVDLGVPRPAMCDTVTVADIVDLDGAGRRFRVVPTAEAYRPIEWRRDAKPEG